MSLSLQKNKDLSSSFDRYRGLSSLREIYMTVVSARFLVFVLWALCFCMQFSIQIDEIFLIRLERFTKFEHWNRFKNWNHLGWCFSIILRLVEYEEIDFKTCWCKCVIRVVLNLSMIGLAVLEFFYGSEAVTTPKFDIRLLLPNYFYLNRYLADVSCEEL